VKRTKGQILLLWYLLASWLLVPHTCAQLPVAWDAGLFGDQFEELTGAAVLRGGGYVLGGTTYSTQWPQFSATPRGQGDYLVASTDYQGQLQWVRLFGGDAYDRLTAVAVTSDNYIVAVGHSRSAASYEKSGPNYGQNDYWVVFLNDKGDLLWERTFGGSGDDLAYSVTVSPAGDIYVAGFSNSPADGNKTAPAYGSNDYWIICLDAAGNKIWDRTYGGPGDERLYYEALAVDAAGNLLVAGSSDSPSGPMKSSPGFGGMDFWILKLAPDGQLLQETTVGGAEEDQAQNILAAGDGGILVGGGTRSAPGGMKSTPFYGLIDYWLVKLDAGGNLLWERDFGGSGLEVVAGMVETAGGMILLGGLSDSPVEGNKTAPNIGSYDYWLIMLDAQGNERWQQTYGSSGSDALTILLATPDGGFLAGGDSDSGPGGVKTTDNYGFNDFWYFKLDCAWDYEADYHFTGCAGEVLHLDLTDADCPNCIFIWPDGQQGAAMDYDEQLIFGQTFDVTVVNGDGCRLTKQVVVEFAPAPNFSLGPDTAIYRDEMLVLRPEPMPAAGTWTWTTGDTSRTILVDRPGTYGLYIRVGACVGYDEVSITSKGTRDLYIPTVFSPNDDGFNDIFYVYGDQAVEEIENFRIYDRWGTLVFDAAHFAPGSSGVGWDGKYRGRPMPAGVYLYSLMVRFTDQSRRLYSGDVTLLR